MTIARRAYFIALAEANEQAKMENQLAALKRKLEEEAEAREKMAADNRALQDRLTQVRLPPCREQVKVTCDTRPFLATPDLSVGASIDSA